MTPATVDNVPREALRVVLALAAREIGNRDDTTGGAILTRALAMVRAAYDAPDGAA
jgi:hypothetical protein